MTQSATHQTHLDSARAQLQTIIDEIQQLNNQVASKRETALKVQGVVEYLEQVIAADQQSPLDSMPVATDDETAVNTALS
tara:strand:- start:112 stop:351 length:240 start_codon:yes stop_codon:yes gene_type:complete